MVSVAPADAVPRAVVSQRQPMIRMKVQAARRSSIALLIAASAGAQTSSPAKPDDALASTPVLEPLTSRAGSELANVVERYTADQASLARRYDAPQSPDQRLRMREFYSAWRARLGELNFDKLSRDGRVDYVLLDNHLVYQLALLDRQEKNRQETLVILPFADRLLGLQDARRAMTPVNGAADARLLATVAKQIDSLRVLFETAPGRSGGAVQAGDTGRPRGMVPHVTKTGGNRAAEYVDQIRGVVRNWYAYYDGFDPMFSWWIKDPFRRVDDALTNYARTLRQRVVGIPQGNPQVATGAPAAGGGRGAADAVGGRGGGENGGSNDGPIIGDPIGTEGLKADLVHEMIPYTPEELIAIAEKEYAFSLSEAKKASREMGFGDNWKAAMEKVKDTYVPPGEQPELIRKLARDAEAFFDQHDWVTIPPLAREDWRMDMLSPERQKVSPFFLGGDQILVSYPTADMSDEDKLMSMRGNNPYFSHATVFHELNPGHHLQGFMSARYNQHRRIFGTPFWGEGQSLYWEMFLWDHGFQVSPEDRMGALFWRMHRSARIIFSLSFHLGKMTPEQAIQFLVDTVDFERANAEAEVRRSFNGTYAPLYQIGYMIGGLQLRALHHELVDTKKMTEREFHDAVLQGGPMPIAMVRARLANTPLTRQGAASWRWDTELPPPIPAPIK